MFCYTQKYHYKQCYSGVKMSYEGYSQFICEKGHTWNVNCEELPQDYDECVETVVCPECKSKAIWENMVNLTNGSFDEEGNRNDGYIELEVKSETSGICSACGDKHVCKKTYQIPPLDGFIKSEE